MLRDLFVLEAAMPLTGLISRPTWSSEYTNNLFLKVNNGNNFGTGQILTAALNLSYPYKYLIRKIKPFIIGRDETEVQAINHMLRRLFFNAGSGITTGVIGGIDVALWDLYSRSQGKPLYEILNGKNTKIGRYVSLPRFNSVEDVVKVVAKLWDSGATKIKLHQNHEESLEAIRILNRDFPQLDLMIDLSCTLSETQAEKIIGRLSNFELRFVEEPLFPPYNYTSLRKLNKIIPIAGGENIFTPFEFEYCVENEVFSYFQPDVSKIGGITVGLKFLEIAKRSNVPIYFHNRPNNGWIQILASAHLASVYSGHCLIETPHGTVPTDYYYNHNEVNNEYVSLRGKGLGIALKENLPPKRKQKILLP